MHEPNKLVYASNLFSSYASTERGLDVFAIRHPAFETAVELPHFNFGLQMCLSALYRGNAARSGRSCGSVALESTI